MKRDRQDNEIREALEQIESAGKKIGRAAFSDVSSDYDRDFLLRIATVISELMNT